MRWVGGGYYHEGWTGISGKKPGRGWCKTSKKWFLFSEDLLDFVTDKSTQDEDDEKHKYIKEDTGRSQSPEGDAHPHGEKVLRSHREDDPENKADNDTIFKETVIVLLSLMEKAKRNT
jgi:hypothetical protein